MGVIGGQRATQPGNLMLHEIKQDTVMTKKHLSRIRARAKLMYMIDTLAYHRVQELQTPAAVRVGSDQPFYLKTDVGRAKDVADFFENKYKPPPVGRDPAVLVYVEYWRKKCCAAGAPLAGSFNLFLVAMEQSPQGAATWGDGVPAEIWGSLPLRWK